METYDGYRQSETRTLEKTKIKILTIIMKGHCIPWSISLVKHIATLALHSGIITRSAQKTI